MEARELGMSWLTSKQVTFMEVGLPANWKGPSREGPELGVGELGSKIASHAVSHEQLM
jgi:hypothetical protein